MKARLPLQARLRELEQVGNYRGAVRARISTTVRRIIIEGLFHKVTEVPLSSLLHGEETAASDVTQIFMTLPVLAATHEEVMRYRSEFTAVKRLLESRYQEIGTDLNFPRDWAAEYGLSEVAYCLIRHLKPRQVVETGVANGHLSLCILSALKKNQSGRLVSIDVHDRVGKLLTAEERREWQLCVLPFLNRSKGFRDIMSELKDVEIFIHDSDHSYRWQWLEYTEAQRVMNGGVVISDDADSSFAFSDFCSRSNLERWYLFDGRKIVGVAAVGSSRGERPTFDSD